MSRRNKSFFGVESGQFSELYDPFNLLGDEGRGRGIEPLGDLSIGTLYPPGTLMDDQLRLAMFHRANPTIPWTPANYGAKGSKDIGGDSKRYSQAVLSYLQFRFGKNVTAQDRKVFVAALKKDTPYADDIRTAGLYAEDIQGYEASANLPKLPPAPDAPKSTSLQFSRPTTPSRKPTPRLPPQAPVQRPRGPSGLVLAETTPIYHEAPAAKPAWTDVQATTKPIYTEAVRLPEARTDVPMTRKPLYQPAPAQQPGLVLAETTPIYHTATPSEVVPAVQDAAVQSPAAPVSTAAPETQVAPSEEVALETRAEEMVATEGTDPSKMINKVLIGAGIAAAAGAVYYFGFRKKSR